MTDGRTDGQTEFSSQYRVCITCSAVKIVSITSMLPSQHQIPTAPLVIGAEWQMSVSSHQCDTWKSTSTQILSMRTHISKTVSACFAVLRQIRSIHRSLTRPVLQSLVASLVLTRLDYGCSTLAGLPARQLKQLQSVMNSAARLVYSVRRSEHVSPLLQELHWLRVPERVDFRFAVLVYRCINGTAPRHLASELQRVADIESRGRLRSFKRALKTELFRRSYDNAH